MIVERFRKILLDKIHELIEKSKTVSRLGWIWLSAGFIVAVLVCAALWHYPVWHTDEITNETASVLGFDDTPGCFGDMPADSIVTNALNARIYSHGIALASDNDTPAAFYENEADSATHHADDPNETPMLDPYLDTPEE